MAAFGIALLAGSAPGLASEYDVLYAFELPAEDSRGRLVQGPGGALYGTTSLGGWYGSGVVFKVNTDGSAYTDLHDFEAHSGAVPQAGLVVGPDKALYGTTYFGGASGDGFVFRIQADGLGFATLHEFDGADGSRPFAELVVGPDSALYGTTRRGGSSRDGVLFKINADGSGFTKLHDFADTNGARPTAGLVFGPGGALYGTTSLGGANDLGVVFKINADGSAFAKLHDFGGEDGANPYAALVVGADSALYGTTYSGGAGGGGIVFRINADGSAFTELHDFGGEDGANPYAGLVVGADGDLYGTTYSGGAGGRDVVFKIESDSSAFTKLHDFDVEDGVNPEAALVVGPDGAFYSTASRYGPGGAGTVFRLAAFGPS